MIYAHRTHTPQGYASVPREGRGAAWYQVRRHGAVYAATRCTDYEPQGEADRYGRPITGRGLSVLEALAECDERIASHLAHLDDAPTLDGLAAFEGLSPGRYAPGLSDDSELEEAEAW